MKTKIIALSIATGTMLFLLYAARSYAATQTQELKFHENSPWVVTVELQAHIDASGKASVAISKCSPKNASAWANYKAVVRTTRAKLVDAGTDRKRFAIETTVDFSGQANRFSSHFTNAHESVVEWGPGSSEATPEIQHPFFILLAKDYPELAKIENVYADETPMEFQGTGAPVSSSIAPQSEEEFPERTFIRVISGDVMIIKPDNTLVRAKDNMDLEIGDMIETGVEGKVELVLSGTALLKVKPLTRFIIPEDKRNTKEKVSFIQMVKGVLWARAKKDDDSLKVATPNAICGLRGTEFNISFLDGVTWVEVIEGTVWLAEAEGMPESVVKAGQRASIPKQDSGIAGQWKTDFGTVTFTQSQDIIKGTYTHDNGRIEGKLEGNILRGKWSEGPSYNPPKDAGEMELVFSQDQKSFKGNWRYGFGGESWSGQWKGTKLESL